MDRNGQHQVRAVLRRCCLQCVCVCVCVCVIHTYMYVHIHKHTHTHTHTHTQERGPVETPLPANWTAHMDTERGMVYYFNTVTGDSRWDPPSREEGEEEEEEEEEDQEGEEDNEELAEDWEQHMYQEERKKRASDAGESRDVRQDMDGGERDAPVGQAPVQPGHADAGAIQYKFGPAWAFRGGGGEQDAEEGAGGARKQCKLTDSEAEDSDALDARASGPVGGLYQVVGGEGNEGGVQGREAQGHEADLARRPPPVVTQAPVPADPVITPRLGMALYLTSPSTAAVPTGTHSEGTPVSHAG